ncbi:MAG: type-F conjugative transfer system protein TraW [Proteobacteria bacterium]|nr:type-F conjugative transfer system protein TraW [Pseudomonadota bacterium]
MKSKALFLFLLLSSMHAMAEDKTEVIGNIYQIQEVSLIDTILNKLTNMEKSGELAKKQEEMKEIAIDRIEHPMGVDLPRAFEDNKHYFDPSIVVTKDIYLPDGRLLHAAGTKVNPLTIKTFTKRIVFIDATDEDQLAWAKKQYEKSGWRDKIILVKGSYMDVMKKWNKRVYFDQIASMDGGKRETLVEKFGIKALPSVVYQEGDKLRIDEVKL